MKIKFKNIYKKMAFGTFNKKGLKQNQSRNNSIHNQQYKPSYIDIKDIF